jgi:hypothetical protein
MFLMFVDDVSVLLNLNSPSNSFKILVLLVPESSML